MAEVKIAEFWLEFATATGADASYSAWSFGSDDDPEMQTRLGLLVLNGPKRATAGLLAEYKDEDEPHPRVGDYSVILDGRGDPLCIIRTIAVEVRAFGEVDEGFAWTEGEGDRTLEWWRRAHRDFFTQRGFTIEDDTQMVLERFDLVWPDPRSSH